MKINLKDHDKIFAAIEAVQSRCSARRLKYNSHISIIKLIEDRLKDLKVPKKHWNGMKFRWVEGMQQFPGKYNGRPEGTSIVVERFKSGWFLVECTRRCCDGSPNNELILLNESEYQKFFKF
jgi:hypothetical protein